MRHQQRPSAVKDRMTLCVVEMPEEPVDILEEVRLSWVDDPSSVKF